MGDFEEVHRDRIVGSLAMFDRLIFKGHRTAFYRPRAVRAFLWNQGVPLTRFAEYLRGVIEGPHHPCQATRRRGRSLHYQ